jgi:hypothetical protein
MDTVTENSWHLQKGVPIALILAIAIQTAGGEIPESPIAGLPEMVWP